MGNASIHLSRVTLAAQNILNGYGHWFANDLRGSGSTELRDPKFEPLGPIHRGRKKIQPPRTELKGFFRQAEPKLDHPLVWFDERMRQVVGDAFGRAVAEHGYTCWACAVMPNHAHLVIRTHRDKHPTIWANLTHAASVALREAHLVPFDHPVWAQRPYGVLMFAKPSVVTRLRYVEQNPLEAGLPAQRWSFVTACPFDSTR